MIVIVVLLAGACKCRGMPDGGLHVIKILMEVKFANTVPNITV